jgi:hypothetical protein
VKGKWDVPIWGSILLTGYLGLLFFAALWAVVERTRSVIVERTGRLPSTAVVATGYGSGRAGLDD